MHTLTLQPPDDNWYMDTGAMSHMTSSPCTLSSYFQLSKNNGIVIGNGSMIRVRGYGHTSLAKTNPLLTLKQCFTCTTYHQKPFITDLTLIWFLLNLNPLGFSMKDLRTGSHLMRCESSGDLYLFTTVIRAMSSSTLMAFTALSPIIWHSPIHSPQNGKSERKIQIYK